MKINGLPSVADPDDFAIGTDLTHAFEGITLSVEGHPERTVIVADGYSSYLEQNFASTGVEVFGQSPVLFEPHWWDQELGLLRVDFAHGTDFSRLTWVLMMTIGVNSPPTTPKAMY